MNEYDSSRIYDLTSTIGFEKTDIKEEANCFVLNTCHIRKKAAEKVYDEVGRIKKIFRNFKKPLIIIAGCVAQAESEEMIKREPYVDIVIGPQSYHKITDLILNYERKKKKIIETEFDVVKKFDELEKVYNLQNKISSYLTIQEGCDKFCHFCVVPYTRGPEYSRPFTQIIDEAKRLVKNGTKEIVLLGQNVNAYNYFDGNKSYKLSSLIKRINEIENLSRIRFTTSHPKDMTEDLIECYKNCTKLMPFLHLPIQSASNRILKSMNRRHDKEYYISIIKKLKNINENIRISSDFIVGYPGESEDDFNETIDLIGKIGFINSYSFIFSPRPGTPASEKKLNNLKTSEQRLKKMQNLLESLQYKNNKNYQNKICKVLIENKLDNQEKYFGRTECMTPVIFNSNDCTIGEIIEVEINSFNKKNLFGFHKLNKEKAA
tara:strand:+ start:1 stop:1299 length:1299 start_codon:yes stop_codon:yes gene_type:complete